MFETLLITNIFATFFLAGVIWFVQIVQYPGFCKVNPSNFQSFHLFHIYRVAFVVTLPMLIELGTSIWLVLTFERLWILNIIGLALVIGIWISTFTVQLPLHINLQQQSSPEQISKLIMSNWIRTIFWSMKAGIGVFLIYLL